MAIIEGKVGPQVLSDGSNAQPRLAKDGSSVTSSIAGKHYELASRSMIFVGGIAGTGVAPGTALATTAQALLLYNPIGSGVNCSVIRFAHAHVSGTRGLGFWVVANYSTLQPGTNVAPAGTACVVHGANGDIGGNKALLYNAATCTAAPIFNEVLDWEGVLDGTGATQVGASREYLFDGSCLVKPGTAKVFTYVGGAGTTPLVAVSAKWAELAI